MKSFFIALAGGTVAGIFIVLGLFAMVVGGIMSVINSASMAAPRPDGPVVLTLDLRRDMTDGGQLSFLPFIRQIGFVDIISRLDAAARDEKVAGVFVRVGQRGPGSARAEELRSAFQTLRQAGKFVVSHAQGFGIGPSGYRAVSAGDEIVMQPGSDFAVSGLLLETLFLKETLDKIEVTPELIAIGKYKNGPNVYTQTDYTAPHAEALRSLGESIWEISVAELAADRNMDEETMRDLLAGAPLSAEDAVLAGLVDLLSWPEETLEATLKRPGLCDDDCTQIGIGKYVPPKDDASAPVIALVNGEGVIVTGRGESPDLDSAFVSDAVAGELLDASEDEDVRAVVFRIDSPGGSVQASDQVWRAVERVREAGKPVIISMGPLAASGGYYVSMSADAILANRTTITGSIGVYGGKFAIGGGLRKLGIQPRNILIGAPFAGIGSTDVFSEQQRNSLTQSLQRTYDRFVDLAAEGRNMTRTDMDAIAQGRVWSGEDALQLGLVDEMGGYIRALEKARELAGIDAGAPIRVRHFTASDDPVESILALLQSGGKLALLLRFMTFVFGADPVSEVLDIASDEGHHARMSSVAVR